MWCIITKRKSIPAWWLAPVSSALTVSVLGQARLCLKSVDTSCSYLLLDTRGLTSSTEIAKFLLLHILMSWNKWTHTRFNHYQVHVCSFCSIYATQDKSQSMVPTTMPDIFISEEKLPRDRYKMPSTQFVRVPYLTNLNIDFSELKWNHFFLPSSM